MFQCLKSFERKHVIPLLLQALRVWCSIGRERLFERNIDFFSFHQFLKMPSYFFFNLYLLNLLIILKFAFFNSFRGKKYALSLNKELTNQEVQVSDKLFYFGFYCYCICIFRILHFRHRAEHIFFLIILLMDLFANLEK